MTWVAWRQHRAGVLTALGVIAAAAVVMLFMRLSLASALADAGASGCLTNPSTCDTNASMMVLEDFGAYATLWPLVLYLLPVVLGLVAGAPLFAKELSQGTHVFSLTQSVSRKRWWAVKLAVCLGPILVGVALLGLFSLWALGPVLDLVGGRMLPGNFEVMGTVMIGYLVLAFSLAATLGLLTRNNVMPMVITVAVYIVVAVAVVLFARPSFLPPLSDTVKMEEAAEDETMIPDGSWQLREKYVDPEGKQYSDIMEACPESDCDDSQIAELYLEYHPASRFWTFQGIETGVYLVLGAAALAAGARRLRALP